jgi:hypothetical protein
VWIQSASSQGRPKAVESWWNLVKQVPFVFSYFLLILLLFTLLDCSSGNTTYQDINHNQGVGRPKSLGMGQSCNTVKP